VLKGTNFGKIGKAGRLFQTSNATDAEKVFTRIGIEKWSTNG